MRTGLITVILAVLLLASSFTVGLTLQGASQRQGKNAANPGASGVPASSAQPQPVFVVKALAVDNKYVYAASFLKKIPQYMLAPLPGLAIVIVGLPPIGTARRGLPYNNQLLTNSSGIGEGIVPSGNYTIHTASPNFNFSTLVGFRQGMITFLNLTVLPFAGNVSSIFVLNQDTLVGVQPTATVYATVKGHPMLATSTYTELLGGGGPRQSRRPAAPSPLITIVLTVLGTYPFPEGTVVAMKPQTSYSFLPSSDLTLIQFRTNSTVNYVGG